MKRLSGPRERGMTLPELLTGLGVAGLLMVAAVPTYGRSLQAAAIKGLSRDGQVLQAALARYQSDHGHPPTPGSEGQDGLNLRTLAPLTTDGYLTNETALLARLQDKRVLAYDTPGLPGREGYWLLLVDAARPEIQMLVAATDQFPLAPDQWVEGVYLIRGSKLEPVATAPLPDEPEPESAAEPKSDEAATSDEKEALAHE